MVHWLGFSSHAPIPFDCAWTMKKQALEPYIFEINELKKSNPQIEIYAGLEVDYIPGVTSPGHFQGQLDYTILQTFYRTVRIGRWMGPTSNSWKALKRSSIIKSGT